MSSLREKYYLAVKVNKKRLKKLQIEDRAKNNSEYTKTVVEYTDILYRNENEKKFTFSIIEDMRSEKHVLKTVKSLNELTDIMYKIDFTEQKGYRGLNSVVNNKNIEILNNALIYFTKNSDQKELKEFLKTFQNTIRDVDYGKSGREVIDYCNNNLKELAEKNGIKNFNIDITNDSVDKLYEKLNQIAGIEIKIDNKEDKNIVGEEIETDSLEDFEKSAQELSELKNKEKSETPMKAYNKIIRPAIEGINNIKKDNNIITFILNTNEEFSSTYKIVLKNNLTKFINKLPKENQEKLKNILLKEGVREKLNEITKESGIKLGNELLKRLEKKNSIAI